MRASAAIVLAVCGCYRPTIPADVPCGAGDSCPTGQSCDHSQSPPTCVVGDGGGVLGSDAARFDAPGDGVNNAMPDAYQPDAYVTPIAFVQEVDGKPTAAATTLAFAMDVSAHDLLVVCFNYPASSGVTVVSLTDSLGNMFHNPINNLGGDSDEHYLYFANNTLGGTDTVTLTLSATITGADLFALEYSGIAEHFPFDVESDDSDTTTDISSGSATTTVPHELIFGYAEAPHATPGTGFTMRGSQSGNLVEDMTVFDTGSYAATATTTAGAWTMIMATFKGQ